MDIREQRQIEKIYSLYDRIIKHDLDEVEINKYKSNNVCALRLYSARQRHGCI